MWSLQSLHLAWYLLLLLCSVVKLLSSSSTSLLRLSFNTLRTLSLEQGSTGALGSPAQLRWSKLKTEQVTIQLWSVLTFKQESHSRAWPTNQSSFTNKILQTPINAVQQNTTTICHQGCIKLLLTKWQQILNINSLKTGYTAGLLYDYRERQQIITFENLQINELKD